VAIAFVLTRTAVPIAASGTNQGRTP